MKPFSYEGWTSETTTGIMKKTIEQDSTNCSFSWEKLMEMKEQEIEFWAGDGLTRLRILDADMRHRTIHMITHKGEKTWPLKFQKLEYIHNKIHNGEIAPIAHEIDKYAPLRGNNIKGLLQHLGCLATLRDVSGEDK